MSASAVPLGSTSKKSSVHEYVSTIATIGGLVQPFQRAFTPKGEAKFEPYVNKVRHQKVDFKFEALDELYQSYLGYLIDEDIQPEALPFVRYVVQELIYPGIRQDIENDIVFSGEWAEPTANTAGEVSAAADGIGTIIEREINDGNITPIPTGVITQSNAVDKFESFCDAIPHLYRSIPGNIYCSPTLARYYSRDYRNQFGKQTNDQLAKNNLSIDATNKTVVGLPSMEGSNMIFFTPGRNMIKMFNKVYVPNAFEFQRVDRSLKLLTDWFRGYGFRTLELVFVNDQPVTPA